MREKEAREQQKSALNDTSVESAASDGVFHYKRETGLLSFQFNPNSSITSSPSEKQALPPSNLKKEEKTASQGDTKPESEKHRVSMDCPRVSVVYLVQGFTCVTVGAFCFDLRCPACFYLDK